MKKRQEALEKEAEIARERAVEQARINEEQAKKLARLEALLQGLQSNPGRGLYSGCSTPNTPQSAPSFQAGVSVASGPEPSSKGSPNPELNPGRRVFSEGEQLSQAHSDVIAETPVSHLP